MFMGALFLLYKDDMKKVCLKCNIVFLDKAKNHSAKYCSLKCKNYVNQTRWRLNNPLKDRFNTKAYRQRNPLKSKQIRENYDNDNSEKVRKIKAAYHVKRLKTDVQYKLRQLLRTRLNNACIKKNGSAITELGCSVKELRIYLESKFQPGMTWDNWSIKGWHLDHIEPLYKFDLSDIEQFKKACHYTNLRPLWAKDHIVKTIQENIDAKTKI